VFDSSIKELQKSREIKHILDEKSSLDFDSSPFVKFLYNYLLQLHKKMYSNRLESQGMYAVM
jgi:hypothetical protein